MGASSLGWSPFGSVSYGSIRVQGRLFHVRTRRLEALVLALLAEPMDLETLYTRLKPLCPTLRKEGLFGLLVRLKQQGRLGFSEGVFFAKSPGPPH